MYIKVRNDGLKSEYGFYIALGRLTNVLPSKRSLSIHFWVSYRGINARYDNEPPLTIGFFLSNSLADINALGVYFRDEGDIYFGETYSRLPSVLDYPNKGPNFVSSEGE